MLKRRINTRTKYMFTKLTNAQLASLSLFLSLSRSIVNGKDADGARARVSERKNVCVCVCLAQSELNEKPNRV